MQADLNSSFVKITFLYNLDYSGSTLELLIQFILGNIFRILAILDTFILYLLNLFPLKFRYNLLLNKFSAITGFTIDNDLNKVINGYFYS
ncbi:MAG: hypothetical protein B655_0614 [Methanobacterium sp. Maddingley MBC34]|nr:MAG: hypothetical protein B655_0614 [Methanobacterium sp. Maddingley MBC34]